MTVYQGGTKTPHHPQTVHINQFYTHKCLQAVATALIEKNLDHFTLNNFLSQAMIHK
jgi:hypothetical protein